MNLYKRCVVLGYGLIGQAFVDIASENIGNFVIIDPKHSLPANGGLSATVDFITKDVFSEGVLDKALKGADYCVNFLPLYDPKQVKKIVQACLKHKVNYFDVTEDVEVGKMIAKLAQKATKSVLVPHCGLAPGLINIIAQNLTKHFESVTTIKMAVGAIPQSVGNHLQYMVTWSAEGVFNEYIKPAPFIYMNERKESILGSGREWQYHGHEKMFLDGREYEAFYTSGGCSTMLDTWEGKANNVSYKSIRYPGHLNAVKEYQDRFITGGNSNLKYALEGAKSPIPIRDRVLIYATVSGKVKGQIQDQTAQYFAQVDFDASINMQAIQKLTAAGVAGVLELHLRDNSYIKRSGFIKQEDVPWEQLLFTSTFERLNLTEQLDR